jgi:hypothetical protein
VWAGALAVLSTKPCMPTVCKAAVGVFAAIVGALQ